MRNLILHFLKLVVVVCMLYMVHSRLGTRQLGGIWTVFSEVFVNFFTIVPGRADYIEITDSNIFPKKFCSVRWVENTSVVQRAWDIYNNIKKYVENSKLPSSFTVKTVKESVADPLTPCTISFLINIASVLKLFLRHFQSYAPLVPFFISAIGSYYAKSDAEIHKKGSTFRSNVCSKAYENRS